MPDRVTDTDQKPVGRRQGRRTQVALPLLPVRDVVVFPYMVLPLPVGREASLRALEKALAFGRPATRGGRRAEP